MLEYTTTIGFDWSTYGYVCKAEFNEGKPIHHTEEGNLYVIKQSPYFPATHSYQNHRLFLYNISCESNQVLFIHDFIVGLQKPISYQGYEYCVDYVKINPPINYGLKYYCGDWEKTCYCGDEDYDGRPITLNASTVEVTFRTSEWDNAYPGFKIRFSCADTMQTEEDVLLEYLQLPSKSAPNHQQVKL